MTICEKVHAARALSVNSSVAVVPTYFDGNLSAPCNRTCNETNLMVVHIYPTDKYGAAAKVSAVIVVGPPNITGDSSSFIGDILNGSMKDTLDKGEPPRPYSCSPCGEPLLQL